MKEEFLNEIEKLEQNKKIKSLNDTHIDLNYKKFKELLELTEKGYYFSTVLDSNLYKKDLKQYYVLEGGAKKHHWIRTTFWNFDKKNIIRFGFDENINKWNIVFCWKKGEEKPNIIKEFSKKIYPKKLFFDFSNTKGEYNDKTKPYDQKLFIEFEEIPKYISIIDGLINEKRITEDSFKKSFIDRFDFIKEKLEIEENDEIEEEYKIIINETNLKEIDETEYEGIEGKKSKQIHNKIERDPKLIKEAKKKFIEKNGKLFCEVCGFDFNENFGENFVEAHHENPLYKTEGKEVGIKISDLKMLCANCHRMIHRKNCPSIKNFKEQYFKIK